MPSISFSTMRDAVKSGRKKQTIRLKKSDYWLRFSKGDPVYGYWKLRTGNVEKLFESELSEKPFVVRWRDFDDELMIRDGFKSLGKANEEWFIPRYGKDGKIVPEMEFVVLRWEKPKKKAPTNLKRSLSRVI